LNECLVQAQKVEDLSAIFLFSPISKAETFEKIYPEAQRVLNEMVEFAGTEPLGRKTTRKATRARAMRDLLKIYQRAKRNPFDGDVVSAERFIDSKLLNTSLFEANEALINLAVYGYHPGLDNFTSKEALKRAKSRVFSVDLQGLRKTLDRFNDEMEMAIFSKRGFGFHAKNIGLFGKTAATYRVQRGKANPTKALWNVNR
jgi:hypothetical protein